MKNNNSTCQQIYSFLKSMQSDSVIFIKKDELTKKTDQNLGSNNSEEFRHAVQFKFNSQMSAEPNQIIDCKEPEAAPGYPKLIKLKYPISSNDQDERYDETYGNKYYGSCELTALKNTLKFDKDKDGQSLISFWAARDCQVKYGPGVSSTDGKDVNSLLENSRFKREEGKRRFDTGTFHLQEEIPAITKTRSK